MNYYDMNENATIKMLGDWDDLSWWQQLMKWWWNLIGIRFEKQAYRDRYTRIARHLGIDEKAGLESCSFEQLVKWRFMIEEPIIKEIWKGSKAENELRI